MVDAGLEVEKFLVIKVPDDTLVERGCGRRLGPPEWRVFDEIWDEIWLDILSLLPQKKVERPGMFQIFFPLPRTIHGFLEDEVPIC